MKVNDIIICKKNYKIYKKHARYKITNIIINDSIFHQDWIVCGDAGMRAQFGFGLHFSLIEVENCNYFYNYFYTLKEYRKLKLGRINESSFRNKWRKIWF